MIPNYAIRVKVVGGNIVTGVVSRLTPWTNYTVVVQGYNSAGLGPPSDEVVFVRTLDSRKWATSRCCNQLSPFGTDGDEMANNLRSHREV